MADTINEYVDQNPEFLARVLAHGDTEAKGYALAVIANSASVKQIEQVQRELEKIKRELSG